MFVSVPCLTKVDEWLTLILLCEMPGPCRHQQAFTAWACPVSRPARAPQEPCSALTIGELQGQLLPGGNQRPRVATT